ncbi:hypothetical protein O181_076641 [Austropuccinia psidii MF-1]|uniref:Uncharacterized protein n=1 Tax=Austropuccinia psidii MF-1 TaxID=1389203 RepID=A0A9Q3FAT2_9BASI|nr:hypothetical protein [Austropuccinia psidii MF-1]
MDHPILSHHSSHPHSWPLIPDSDQPPPPFYHLSQKNLQQALFTTYPSRIHLGTTSLAQPIYTNTYFQHRLQRPNSPTDSNSIVNTNHLPSNSFSNSLESGKRNRKLINYSENDKFQIDFLDSEIALDDENSKIKSNSIKNRPSHHSRLSLNSNLNQTPNLNNRFSTPTPSDSDQKKRDQDEIQKKRKFESFLARDPPAKSIIVQRRSKRSPVLMNLLSKSQNEFHNDHDQVCLVPIRIEFETDQIRIRDVFTWNLLERHITPEIFSVEFCTDIGISAATYVPKITQQIKSQLKELSSVSATKLLPNEDHLSKFSKEKLIGIEPDLRVVIQLDVQIESLHLVDRIEWDLASPLTPELFTIQYTQDLNLPRSANPIIAHAIHEEICRHKRDCLGLGLIAHEIISSVEPSGSFTSSIGLVSTTFKPETDPLLKEKYGNNKGTKKLEGVWRDWNEANGFGPKLEILHPEDLEWIELEKERAARRSRREQIRPVRRR